MTCSCSNTHSLTTDHVEDEAGIIVKGMLFQFKLVDATEAVLSQKPLNRLDYVQLSLGGMRERERERERERVQHNITATGTKLLYTYAMQPRPQTSPSYTHTHKCATSKSWEWLGARLTLIHSTHLFQWITRCLRHIGQVPFRAAITITFLSSSPQPGRGEERRYINFSLLLDAADTPLFNSQELQYLRLTV